MFYFHNNKCCSSGGKLLADAKSAIREESIPSNVYSDGVDESNGSV